jgi:hypothetical protein
MSAFVRRKSIAPAICDGQSRHAALKSASVFLFGRVSMQDYEIRLLGSNTPSIHLTSQASDFAAIRRALRLAAKADGVEVWRGFDCVYAGTGNPRHVTNREPEAGNQILGALVSGM